MAPEWEAIDLGMGLVHHHTTSTTTMPPAPSRINHYFYGGGAGGHTAAPSSSSFNLSFADDFSIPAVPSEEAAELEWLSNFVDDSYPDMPSYYTPEAIAAVQQQQQQQNNTNNGKPPSVTSSRTKRSRPTSAQQAWQRSKNKQNLPAAPAPGGGGDDTNSRSEDGGVRRCTHCASEKTPQWRTGPLGPKTLCNACGVRYKSGRLVPEYRPAASPTFVLTQHSNSHRKVMELRRQKELVHLRGTSSSASSSPFRDYGLC